MKRLRITGGTLAFAMLVMGNSPAFAGAPGTSDTAAQVAQPDPSAAGDLEPASSFIPPDFSPPTLVEAQGFKLVPLGPDLVDVDFDAYMSSIEHLQQTFSRSTGWPREDISHADAMRDMETEQARFQNRQSFAYAVLTPDGTRERGSVYVSPSPSENYDAVVRMWVTKADFNAGFDAELYTWVTDWVQSVWPFRTVAYPGRSIDWETWDAVVAANASGTATAAH